MDTKRCVNCHKLLRADTPTCSRCGYTFTKKSRALPVSRTVTKPSIPPASPHRAGHYSGLHPEDQPYQSGMIVVPPVARNASAPRQVLAQEPQQIMLPGVERAPVQAVDDPAELQQTQPSVRLEKVARRVVTPAPPSSIAAKGSRETKDLRRSQNGREMQDWYEIPDRHERRVWHESDPNYDDRVTPRVATKRYPYQQNTPAPVPPLPQDSLPPVASHPTLAPPPYVAQLYRPKKGPFSRRSIPVVVAISCLALLLVSSLVALALTGKRLTVATNTTPPSVVATPNVLRTHDIFTLSGNGFGARHLLEFSYNIDTPLRDDQGAPLNARTNNTGAFAVNVVVPTSWQPGEYTIHALDRAQKIDATASITVEPQSSAPPQLQLDATSINFGSRKAGSVDNKIITLINGGGGQITWQASSDATWLNVSPRSDTFSGREAVNVTVNRATLSSQSYTGHVTFESKGGAAPVKLTVQMAVSPDPAALSVSQAALTYSGTPNDNPPSQVFSLQNNGGQPSSWTSSITTDDGASWLSISPSSGQLNARSSVPITVNARSQQLAVGQYQGVINFSGSTHLQVNVTLIVLAPGSLVATPNALSFNAIAGTAAPPLTVILQNTGGQQLNWSLNVAASQGGWLSASPGSGALAPGDQTTVSVVADATALSAGNYQGSINLTSGTITRSVNISFVVTAPPLPAISVQGGPLNFTTYQGTNPQPMTFTITDSGTDTLQWVATEDSTGATFAPVSPAQGVLAPNKSAVLTVTPNVATENATTLTTTITVSDPVRPTLPAKTVPVTITILNRPQISVSATTLSFSNTTTYNYTSQPFILSNTGSAPLNWAVSIQPSGTTTTAGWASVDTTSGTLAAGQHTTLSVRCDSTQLPPGTYTAVLTFSDSDPGNTVPAQSVTISLTVAH